MTSRDNYIYALNADGSLKWRYNTYGYVNISSPAIGQDGTLYVGTTSETFLGNKPYGNFLYALNPDGSLKWRYEAGDKIVSSPAIGHDGSVYFGCKDHYLYALNSNASQKWRYQSDNEINSSPAIGLDGTVYVGSWDNYLYALNPDGTIKWRYKTGGHIDSSPAIGLDGTVYVGSWDNYLYALNPDGTIKWRYKTGYYVRYSSPAIGLDGTVYVGSGDYYLYALNPDGNLKWRYKTGGRIDSSPAISSDGTVYVGSWDKYLYAFHLGDKSAIFGQVRDMSSGELIEASISTDSSFNTQADLGSYVLIVDPGTYEITFLLTGYQDVVLPNMAIQQGETIKADVLLPTEGILNLTREELLPASVGRLYNDRVWVAGGTAPYIFFIAYGSIPDGLTLDPQYGHITGTPTKAGTYTFSIGVTDQQSTYSEREYNIEITPPLEFKTDSPLPRATKNQPYFQNIEAVGGAQPYRFVEIGGSSLTHGMALAENGELSGIPSSSGGTAFIVRVTDDSGRFVDKNFGLSVDDTLAISTNNLNTGIIGQAYNQTLEATGGYGDYSWTVYSGMLPEGLSLDASTGVLSGIPQSVSTVPLVLLVKDSVGRKAFKSLPLIVTAPLAFATSSLPQGAKNEPYSELVRVNGGLPPYTYSYTGLLPSGLSLDTNTGVISGTPTSAGLTNVQISVSDSSIPTAQEASAILSLRVTSLLTITSSAVLPSARLNQIISPVVLTAVSGISPYQWSVSSGMLPSGIDLDSSTGQLSGTPTAAGDYVFTIRVTDSNQQTADKEFIYHVARTLTIDTNVVPDGGRDTFYTYTVRVSGGRPPYSWRVSNGSLPSGLSLDANTGTISGTPATGQSLQFTLEVSDGDTPAQTAQKMFSINIRDEFFMTTETLPNTRIGWAYTATINAALGTLPYTYSLSKGTLPAGLTFSSTALTATITGIPTEAGQFTFTVEVRDSSLPGQTVSKEFTLNVYSLITFTTTGLPNALKGETYDQRIHVVGGLPPYTWSIASGELPAGLSLNSATGEITGIPSWEPGLSAEFTLQVTDTAQPAAPAEKQFTIYVIEPLEVATETIPEASQRRYYEVMISGQGGLSPLTWSISDGVLPGGLSLDAASGTISGVPVECGDFDLTIMVFDSGGVPLVLYRDFHLSVICFEPKAMPWLPLLLDD